MAALTGLVSIGGWAKAAFRIFELPGYIDDATQWLKWAGITDRGFPPLNYPMLITLTAATAVLLTYDWWMPRLRRWHGISDEANYAIQQPRFMALAPLIQRHMADVRPLIEGVEGYEVSSGFDADYDELIGRLEGLGVGYPPAMRNSRLWYQFLGYMSELVEAGQLARAQQLDFSGLWAQEAMRNG